jgi:hypothetical protein
MPLILDFSVKVLIMRFVHLEWEGVMQSV